MCRDAFGKWLLVDTYSVCGDISLRNVLALTDPLLNEFPERCEVSDPVVLQKIIKMIEYI